MASVKKTMKSSATKQAKASRTLSPKAKTSKQSAKSKAAASKARQAAAARALAAEQLAAKKLVTKKLAARKAAAKQPVAKQLAAKQLSTKKSVQKVKTKTNPKSKTKSEAVVTLRANRDATASPPVRSKKKTASATRASASSSQSARAAKKSLATKAVETSRPAASSMPAQGRIAASKSAASKKTVGLKVSRANAAKPAEAARKLVESKSLTAQKPANGKAAAAALLAFKQNAARNQAAAASPIQPEVNSSNMSLKSSERMTVIKETKKKAFMGSASGLAGTIAAPPPETDLAETEAARKAKDAGAPLEAKAVADDAAQLNMAQAKPAASAQKPAKMGNSQRQLFKPGEFVVYPAHGVGQIVAIEEQEVAGFKLELYVISFIKDKMILKVPTPKVISVGMRKLADAAAAKTALDTLAGRARIKRTMWSRRAQEYEAKINSGDLNAIAEVVRDLYRSDTQPEQSYSERQLYEAALDRMTREIVVVQKLTETELLKIIETQLQKGPRRGKAEEIDADEAEIEEAA